MFGIFKKNVIDIRSKQADNRGRNRGSVRCGTEGQIEASTAFQLIEDPVSEEVENL
jgi:hypothetical protein